MSDTIKTPVVVVPLSATGTLDFYAYELQDADGNGIGGCEIDDKRGKEILDEIARALNSEATMRGLLEDMADDYEVFPCNCMGARCVPCERRAHTLTRVRAALAEESK